MNLQPTDYESAALTGLSYGPGQRRVPVKTVCTVYKMEFRIYPQLPASDLARARTWYSEKLGLEPVEDGDELFYDTGAAAFGVYPSDHAGTNHATYARLVVADFDTARAEMLSRGVVFEEYDLGEDFRTVDGVLVSPDGEKTSWFKDSEGNILAMGSSI